MFKRMSTEAVKPEGFASRYRRACAEYGHALANVLPFEEPDRGVRSRESVMRFSKETLFVSISAMNGK